MTVATPTLIVKGFASAGDRAVIPVVPGPTTGRASYNLGFPQATRTAKNAGGVPPFGTDANGILFDVSSNIAWQQGGMGYAFNSTFSTENGGYAVGAILRSATTPSVAYYNTLAGNTTNPDSGGTNWIAFAPTQNRTSVQTITPAAGTTNNLSVPFDCGFLDINPTAGASTITGIIPQADGQRLIVTAIHATNSVTLSRLSGSSSAVNQFRVAADIVLFDFLSVSLVYSTSIGKWVVL